jgi:hypothetical protein
VDCLLWIANGEEPPEENGWTPPQGDFSCGWIEEEYGEDKENEERDSLGFSWSPCDCCGSRLSGDRYAVTLWIYDEGDMH